MYVHSIRSVNFRNLDSTSLDLDSGVNIFVGENAQGKTNILESITCLSDGRSFRGARISEMIAHNMNQSIVEGKINDQNYEMILKIKFESSGRSFFLNGKPVSDLREYLGNIAFTVFSADNLKIAEGEPRVRRDFIDKGIYHLVPAYLHRLKNYRRIVKQRNLVLKSGTPDQNLLNTLTEQLVQVGTEIIVSRLDYLELIKSRIWKIHRDLSEEKEDLRILYQSCFLIEKADKTSISELFHEQISKYAESEKFRGMTLVGPHRDDLKIMINGKDLRIYGSRGQKRTAVMSLKLAEMEIYHYKMDKYPVLILDDIAAELDTLRQKSLMQYIPENTQVLISLTEISRIFDNPDYRIFKVSQGKIM